MAIYEQPTAAETQGSALITTGFTGRVRKDFQLLEGLFDHFDNFYTHATAGFYRSHQDFNNAAAGQIAQGRDWLFTSDTGVAPITRSGTKPHPSVARITVSGTAADYGSAISKKCWQPDTVGLPLIFEGRFRKVANDRGFWIGFQDINNASLLESPALFTTGTTRIGISLVYGSSTQMRFRNVGAGATDGTLANYPTANTWFTIKIIINSASSAVCTVVDAGGSTLLTETFSSDVTIDQPLAARWALGITTASATSLDADWIGVSHEGSIVAP